MTTQDLIQEQLEFITKAENYRLITDKRYSNCGVWRFFTTDDLACMGEIVFDFQAGSMTFECVDIKKRFMARDADQAVGWLYEVVSARA